MAKAFVPDRKWEGPTVAYPRNRKRPNDSSLAAQSLWLPVAVHAAPGVSPERVQATLQALETAHRELTAHGWSPPWPDGGRGGTPGFDLYLRAHVPFGARAFSDAPIPWTPLDAVSSWAAIDRDIGSQARLACVTSAYAQAALLGQDPAEAESWRRATGSWLAWQLTGRFGCRQAAALQQREPWRSWIRNGAQGGAGGGLLLALLSSRREEREAFIHKAWQLARQNSREKPGDGLLRGGPDVWMAIEHILGVRDIRMHDEMAQIGIARWFAGRPARENAAPLSPTTTLGPWAAPPVQWALRWGELPVRTEPAKPALQPYGSVYATVDVSDAPANGRLRIWLRGEYGVAWSLAAVRLGPDGRRLGQASAAPRKIPDAYVPVELLGDVERVLIVATNLSSRLPDADIPDENIRTARLIVDRGGHTAEPR